MLTIDFEDTPRLWSAHFDPEGPIGRGKTKLEAVEELLWHDDAGTVKRLAEEVVALVQRCEEQASSISNGTRDFDKLAADYEKLQYAHQDAMNERQEAIREAEGMDAAYKNLSARFEEMRGFYNLHKQRADTQAAYAEKLKGLLRIAGGYVSDSEYGMNLRDAISAALRPDAENQLIPSPTFPAVPREEMDAALRECDHPHPLNGGAVPPASKEPWSDILAGLLKAARRYVENHPARVVGAAGADTLLTNIDGALEAYATESPAVISEPKFRCQWPRCSCKLNGACGL